MLNKKVQYGLEYRNFITIIILLLAENHIGKRSGNP